MEVTGAGLGQHLFRQVLIPNVGPKLSTLVFQLFYLDVLLLLRLFEISSMRQLWCSWTFLVFEAQARNSSPVRWFSGAGCMTLRHLVCNALVFWLPSLRLMGLDASVSALPISLG